MQENIKNPEQVEQRKFGVSGSTIKMIAIITMLIDHVGAGILGRYLIFINQNFTTRSGDYMGIRIDYETLNSLYHLMRYIGRLGFPLFCFLLVEGFTHTRNVKKYAIRLGLFALISEIPFDLAFHGKLLEFTYQNVFFTLFIGLLTIKALQMIEQKHNIPSILRLFSNIAILFIGMGVATLLRTDYSYIGVASIVVLYILRKNRLYQVIGGAVIFAWEVTAPFAFIPVFFYNGKRGWNIKYFFYIFYPAHLVLIYIISYFLHMASISVMG